MTRMNRASILTDTLEYIKELEQQVIDLQHDLKQQGEIDDKNTSNGDDEVGPSTNEADKEIKDNRGA
ncbi:hypothetical protein ACHQM5_008989 [Ranunculus cassubicifolius]